MGALRSARGGAPEVDPASIPPAVALVDVGATRTSINVLRAGRTCFSREIALGGDDMTQAVARRLGIEPHEAEIVKCDGELHEAEVASSIAPVLEDLASELALSIDYVEHHEGVEVRELLLSGGGSLAAGTSAAIEQATGRPTRSPSRGFQPRVEAEGLDLDALELEAPSLVVAVGLASRVRTR